MRRSFACAARGVWRTLMSERNMRIHACAAFYVTAAGLVCRIEAWQWCMAALCMALVMALECLNTALEALCDEVTGEFSPRIRTAKDAAAGAVLTAAVFSAAVGALIFFRAERLRACADFAVRYPAAAAAIVLSVLPWIKFIFMRRSENAGDNQDRDDNHMRPAQRGQIDADQCPGGREGRDSFE